MLATTLDLSANDTIPTPKRSWNTFDHREFYHGDHWQKRNDKLVHVTELNEQDAMDYLRHKRFINDYDRNKNNKHAQKEAAETAKPFALTVSFAAPPRTARTEKGRLLTLNTSL